jgi:hypothetical protein
MKWVKHLTAVMLLGSTVAVACGSDDDTTATPGSGGSSGSAGAATGGTAGDTVTAGDTGDGGTLSGGGTVSAAGAGGEVDPGPPDTGCTRFQEICANDDDCCSGDCDEGTLTCTSTVGSCKAGGEACEGPTDCCTLLCTGGECSSDACVSDGEACTDGAECCGGVCEGDVCVALNPECSTAGNACDGHSDCCSSLCGEDGTCTLGASYCIQPGDSCYRNEDCCTGTCGIADGALVGVCNAPPEGSTFCEGVDGVVCGTCGDCCSRLCAPYGPTGVNVCQPISGCHSTGDLCRTDEDCCGGAEPEDPADRLPGWGNGECQIEPGHAIGVCRNPVNGEDNPDGACSPQGNVCHLKDYACDNSNARSNCCFEVGANNGACEVDALGVPRCNGLADCREVGETCNSSADCCIPEGSDMHPPCVPDDEGVLRCGEDECIPTGGSCTINADCCPGGTCYRPAGTTEGTCEPPTTGEGGAGGGPGTVCSEYGQQCTDAGDCCNDVPCTDDICKYPPQ